MPPCFGPVERSKRQGRGLELDQQFPDLRPLSLRAFLRPNIQHVLHVRDHRPQHRNDGKSVGTALLALHARIARFVVVDLIDKAFTIRPFVSDSRPGELECKQLLHR
jgi:hypothetical protein